MFTLAHHICRFGGHAFISVNRLDRTQAQLCRRRDGNGCTQEACDTNARSVEHQLLAANDSTGGFAKPVDHDRLALRSKNPDLGLQQRRSVFGQRQLALRDLALDIRLHLCSGCQYQLQTHRLAASRELGISPEYICCRKWADGLHFQLCRAGTVLRIQCRQLQGLAQHHAFRDFNRPEFWSPLAAGRR
ncbi:hypothetical protein D3C72_1550290 [compost metagenome]